MNALTSRVGVCSTSSVATRNVTCMAQRLQGTVSSMSGKQSITVKVETLTPHPLYTKRVKTTKSYMVHDPEGKAAAGDFVELVPCKPLSKGKRFTLGDIVRKAE